MKKPRATAGLTEETHAGLQEAMPPGAALSEALNRAGIQAPGPETEDAPQEYTPEVAARLEQKMDLGLKATALADAMVAQQYELVKTIGQMQTLEAFRAFSAAGNIKLFQQVKESKSYKGLRVPQPDGSLLVINTFEEFCEIMGTSRRKVDEDLQNLKAFGESFMETTKRAGLGYRDFRALRALPEDARQLVIEGERISADDPESVKDLIAEITARYTKRTEELEADLRSKDEVLAKRSKQLDAAQTELEKLKKLPPDKAALAKAEKERDALHDLHLAGMKLLGSFTAYLTHAQNLLALEEVSGHAADMILQLTSALFSHMADDTLAAGIDVDFRIITYPPELGPIALRGNEPADKE